MGAGDFDPKVIGNSVSETHCIKILSLTRIFILFHKLKKQITSQEFNHRYHRLTMEWDGMKGMVDRGVVESGSVVNGSMMNGSMVDRGSMDNWVGGCRGVYGFTGVGNISNVSTISVINTVSDSLDSAVREGYVVASRGCVSVTSFSGTKVDSRVVISSSISIGVSWGNIGVDRGGAIGR